MKCFTCAQQTHIIHIDQWRYHMFIVMSALFAEYGLFLVIAALLFGVIYLYLYKNFERNITFSDAHLSQLIRFFDVVIIFNLSIFCFDRRALLFSPKYLD